MSIAIGNLTLKNSVASNDQIIIQSGGISYRCAVSTLVSTVLGSSLTTLSVSGNSTFGGNISVGGNILIQGTNVSAALLEVNTIKSKVSGIAEGATLTASSSTNGNIKINGTETTVYTLPTATGATLGGVKSGSSTTTGQVVFNSSGVGSVSKVASAEKLSTGRAVTLSGEITGSVSSWDGSSALSIATALAGNVATKVNFNASSTVNQSSTSGTITVPNGGIYAANGIRSGARVYSAVWNDLVDCISVNEDVELEYGYCYCFDGKKYYKSTKYLDEGIIGIHSDTAGFSMGHKEGKELNVSVAGFVLAYVDKEYNPGTPLTCTENGYLTEISKEDKKEYPERIIGTYWKPEPAKEWGKDSEKVKVNGRHWIKIK